MHTPSVTAARCTSLRCARPVRRFGLAALVAVTAAVAVIAAGPVARGDSRPPIPHTAPASYRPPVAPLRVLRPFQPPPTPYAAGHRGVDLATTSGMQVRAAGAGVVRFAGSVAGRGVIVIAHPDGITTEYEPVRPRVLVGTAVAGGTVIATVVGKHGSFTAGTCLHWGARRNGTYFDPLSLLRRLGPVRLLPWSGEP